MKTGIIKISTGLALISLVSLQMACQKKAAEATATEPASSASSTKYIYAVTGICAAGSGMTTFTAATSSNQVIKINAATGNRDSILADYFAFPAAAGDSPVGIVDWDANNLLVLVQNGTSGRVEYLPKTGGTRNSFGLGAGILATAPYHMVKTSDGGLMIARSAAIEKVTSTGIRLGAPWIGANPGVAGTCGAANTRYSSAISTATGRILAINTGATVNRVISVGPAGGTANCIDYESPAQTASWPVALAYDNVNSKVFVAYSGSANTALGFNSIISYDYDDSTGLLSNANSIYDTYSFPATYNYLLYGISAMAIDPSTNTLYVSTAISIATTVVNYAIEKFTYDVSKIGTANSTVLTRSGSVPFYNYGVDTKCISQIVVGN